MRSQAGRMGGRPRAGGLRGVPARDRGASMTYLLLGLVVFLTSMGVDFAQARYIRALHAREPLRAACWSVAQGCAGTVGLILAIEVTLWLLVWAALGWFVGTWLGARSVPTV